MQISRTSLITLCTIGLVMLALMFVVRRPLDEATPLEGDQTEDGGEEMVNGTDERTGNLTITIVYDNNDFDDRLDTAWGFSCLVEGLERTILFDTGGNGSMLLSNMEILGLHPGEIDALVISHVHHDHAGGMEDLLRAHSNLTVYLPASFPGNLKDSAIDSGATLVKVASPMKICKDAYSTGELGVSIKEQSLLIDTKEGLVVITGCAHPGILHIVQQAKKQLHGNVRLALGGFHLSGQSSSVIEGIVQEMRKEGVEKVAPCHCSGDTARTMFEELYGDDFIPAGVGTIIELDSLG